MEGLDKILFEIQERLSPPIAEDKILDLFSVMLSETLEEAENKATEIDDGKSDHSLGQSQGFESGAEWVIERIKEKLHSA